MSTFSSYIIGLPFIIGLGLSINIDFPTEKRFALISNLTGSWAKNEENGTILDLEDNLSFYLLRHGSNDEKMCENFANFTETGGKFFFSCACFPTAGLYALKIGNDTVSAKIAVDWPKISLMLPEKHTALTGSVSVRIRQHSKLCEPETPTFATKLRVLHKRDSFFERLDEYRLLHEVQIADFWTITGSLKLSCEYFDRAGLFKVQLIALDAKNSPSQPKIIAESSNEMRSFWSDKYRLTMRTDGIFPCPDNGVPVSFSRPECDVFGDRIRLYGITNQRGQTLTKPTKLFYLSEQKIYPNRRNVVSFPCNNFDLINLGYCFKYVSVLFDGVVKDNHTVQCVPTRRKSYELQDSFWTAWQHWGACSVSCGSGVQHRTRSCKQPELRYRKSYCTGSAINSQSCNTHPCPNETNDVPADIGLNSACLCGCNLTKSEETIVAYSSLCDLKIVTWIISFDPAETAGKFPEITLLKLELTDTDRLTIRDGRETSDELLFDSEISLETGVLPIRGRSKNGIRVDFWSQKGAHLKKTKESAQDDSKEWHGAIISLKLKAPPVSRKRGRTWSIPFIQILIVCACVAGVLLFLALMATCFVWLTRRKMRENCRQLLASSYRTSDDGSSLQDQDCYASLKKSAKKLTESPKKAGTSPKKENPVFTVRAVVEKSKEKEPLLSENLKPTAANEKPVPITKRLNLINHGINRLSEDLSESMHTSTTTASTRLSGISQKSESPPNLKPVIPPSVPPKCRSIGIQLNSPALPLRKSFGSKSSVSTNQNGPNSTCFSPARADSPSLSLAGTEQDFEYDYYEPNVPGSFLNPDWFRGGAFGELLSEIDIDEIIGDSELMKTPTRTPPGGEQGKQQDCETISVSTQFFAPNHPFRNENFPGLAAKDDNKNLVDTG